MNNMELAGISSELSQDGNYGKFVAGPLERGFGNTLGNALRRVLLSSLPGAAVTSIKIEGISHEFSTVPGVAEDVSEIILNLKSLVVRLNSETSDTTKVLYLDAVGPCEVTAKDIPVDEEVEFIDPDAHIASLNEDAHLQMTLKIGSGRGYVSSDKNKDQNAVIGEIAIDSLFTPVTKVNYTVTDTRVGQAMDHDELTLEVWTNGSMTPAEAVSSAAQILTFQLSKFVELAKTVSINTIQAEGTSTQTTGNTPSILDKTIEELDLSVRAYNCLKRAGINTVGELVEKNQEEMMKVRNLGKKSLEEVEQKLEALGLTLNSSEEN